MRNWILITLAVMVLCLGSASAGFDKTQFDRNVNVPSVTGLIGRYTNTCADFTWNTAETADLNNFVIQTTSNNPEFNSLDFNTRSGRWTACTIAPGEWVRATVYRIEGNEWGLFLNTHPDVNVLVNPGSVAQSGIYLMFQFLVALGSLVSLIVLAGVMVVLFKKTGFKFRIN